MHRIVSFLCLALLAQGCGLPLAARDAFQRWSVTTQPSEVALSVAARAEASNPGVPCPIVGADSEARLGDISVRLALAEGATFPVVQLRNDTSEARALDHIYLDVSGGDGLGAGAGFGAAFLRKSSVLVGRDVDAVRPLPAGAWISIDPPFAIETGAVVRVMRFAVSGETSQVVFDTFDGIPVASEAPPTPASLAHTRLAAQVAAQVERAPDVGCPIAGVDQEIRVGSGVVRAHAVRGPDGSPWHYVIELLNDSVGAQMAATGAIRIVGEDGSVMAQRWNVVSPPPGVWVEVETASLSGGPCKPPQVGSSLPGGASCPRRETRPTEPAS